MIDTEYDVQRILYALLTIVDEDIRPEEPTPTLAGSSARIDFFLNSEKIAIEVKIAKDTHSEKKLKKEISEDITTYQTRHDVNRIIFFIYDPDLIIRNPLGFKRDFEEISLKNLTIEVVIRPTGK